MTQLSHAERRATIERLFAHVADDPQIRLGWKEWMLDMSTPELPDEPTAEQIEAWIELQGLLTDPEFASSMRDNAKDSTPLNGKEMTTIYESLMVKARAAVDQGAGPASATGRELASAYFNGLAKSMRMEPSDQFRAQMRRKHLEHQPKMRRYWDLITILGGLRGSQERKKTWQQPEESRWLGEAINLWFAAG